MNKEITNYKPREQEGDKQRSGETKEKVVTSLTPLT